MASLCALANAEQVQLTAKYTGFIDMKTGIFDPNRTEILIARVDDFNGDNAFTTDEVQEFYFGSIGISSDRFAIATCGGEGISFWCLKSFSYTGGDSLSFDATDGWRDPYLSLQDFAGSGESAYTWINYSDSGGSFLYEGIEWTPSTTVSVVVGPLPVAEPTTYMMLGVGLGALGLLANRRRSMSLGQH